MKFNFNNGFDVLLDGEKIPNVTALQISVDRNGTENKVTLIYQTEGGAARVITVELGAVDFVTA